ncbi:hypothetical protein S7711_07014 [Stachybotrys chartarum IBT 7711]|uniref:CCHC-type domain-containing protein n=1 Tax=Stachybotrys chartarum (strain CBS 109288 / IBT 7711) TaxID=1280523 RepID=A0A084AYD9_STACB|nr:hypothetical protein S7711_07014 [Stachybotrys chartarum IBT 7711]
MSLDQNIPGDVISIPSSDDEASVTLKRPRADSSDQGGSPKRLKPAATSSAGTEASGFEDGEIDETESVEDANEEAATALTAPQPVVGASSNKAYMPERSLRLMGYDIPALADKKTGSWKSRYKAWVTVLCQNNAHHFPPLDQVTPVFIAYVDQEDHIQKKHKKSAKKQARVFEKTGSLESLYQSLQKYAAPSQSAPALTGAGSVDAGKGGNQSVDAKFTHLKGPASNQLHASTSLLQANGQDGMAMAPRQPLIIPQGINALEQQRKYFPSASNPSNMCLLCGREGHTAPSCAHSACQFCGSKEHWKFSCPTRSRCATCQQLGHAANACTGKLSLGSQNLTCAYCESPKHTEADCTEMWRSFHPDADAVQKVETLRPSCASCGSAKHYSDDCQERQLYPQNPTWSLHNRDRYVKEGCGNVAIEDFGSSQSAGIARGPELKIRGHASRTNNVHYSESDDSDVEFLGSRVSKPQPAVGQIRMSSNIQMPKTYGGHGLPAQPPLPPGPPPPLPSSFPGQRPPPGVLPRRLQAPNLPSSLPAKPPAAPRDYRSVPPPPQTQGGNSQSWSGKQNEPSQQANWSGRGRGGAQGSRGRGGRGGRGGKGKGRGRGK